VLQGSPSKRFVWCRSSENSRGDWTPLELFVAGVRSLERSNPCPEICPVVRMSPEMKKWPVGREISDWPYDVSPIEY
jgi:hypothetical protein